MVQQKKIKQKGGERKNETFCELISLLEQMQNALHVIPRLPKKLNQCMH